MISIITPYAPSDARFLLDAYASFATSTVPFEWLLQEDGVAPLGVPQPLAEDSRVQYRANHMHLGAGGTRTMALLRARGDLVVLLDADDLLAPAALEVFVASLGPQLGWVYGQCVAWDGASAAVERSVLAPREYRAGELLETARTLGHLPLYSLPGCYRRDLLERIGGWPSIPRDEDTTVQLTAMAFTPGAILEQVTYIKRQHPHRTSMQPWMPVLHRECRSLVLRRLGVDLAQWEHWLSGDRDTSTLYTREPYEVQYAPAFTCTRCHRIHNATWCPYCGERNHTSYE